MREIAAVVAALSLTALLASASAETPTTISKERQAQVISKLSPTGTRWLSAEITKARSTPGFTEQQARGDAQRAIQNGGISADVDIEAIILIVLMEASTSAQKDLKTIMDGVKAINKEKEGWRSIDNTVNQSVASGPCAVAAATKPCVVAPKVVGPGLLESDSPVSQSGPSATGTPVVRSPPTRGR